MRASLYLISYDIHIGKPHRQARQMLRANKVSGQKSAVENLLTPAQFKYMKKKLAGLPQQANDSIVIFELDPRMPVLCFGQAHHYQFEGFHIV